MMERRTLLKALAAIPAAVVAVDGKEVGRALEIEPNGRYEVFLNAEMVDMDAFCSPTGRDTCGLRYAIVHAVFLRPGQSMDDAVRIYKVE